MTTFGLPEPRPDWPPSLALLLGTPAGQLCAGVLRPLGGRLVDLRATGTTVQPGGSATVRYSAEVSWAGGRSSRELLTARTGGRPLAGTQIQEQDVDGETIRVGVWRWPEDPALPALEWAARPSAAAQRLAKLGLDTGLDTGGLRLTLRSYRPGRRAVLEATTAGGPLFLKVVRPGALAGLVDRHRLLSGSLPVPPVLAATNDGVVVLPGLSGTPMRTLLAGTGHGLPTVAALEALLDGLPAAPVGTTPSGRRPGDALCRLDDHVAVLGLVSPELRPRLAALSDALRAIDPGEHPDVTVHGDFYEAQLLLDGGAVVGLLDVDTVGVGHRIDDWATLLAHLVLLGTILPEPATVLRYRAELEEAVAPRWPQSQLHARVAAVLVGLATGPFRVLQEGWAARTAARIALAEEWTR